MLRARGEASNSKIRWSTASRRCHPASVYACQLTHPWPHPELALQQRRCRLHAGAAECDFKVEVSQCPNATDAGRPREASNSKIGRSTASRRCRPASDMC
eukprot:12235795-Alexandrium_andersonii.AAC.2